MLIASFPPVEPKHKFLFDFLVFGGVSVWCQCVFVSWFHLNLSTLADLLACAFASACDFVAVHSLSAFRMIELTLFVSHRYSDSSLYCYGIVWYCIVLCEFVIFFGTHMLHTKRTLFVVNGKTQTKHFNTRTQFKDNSYGNWHHNPPKERNTKNDIRAEE